MVNVQDGRWIEKVDADHAVTVMRAAMELSWQ
jgi:hypothetical protein